MQSGVRMSRIKGATCSVKRVVDLLVLFLSGLLIFRTMFFCSLIACLSIAGVILTSISACILSGGRFITGWFHGWFHTFRRHQGGGSQRSFRRIIAVIPLGTRKVAHQILFSDEFYCGVDNFFRLSGGGWHIFVALRCLRCGRLFARPVGCVSLHRFACLIERAYTLEAITTVKEVTSITIPTTDLLINKEIWLAFELEIVDRFRVTHFHSFA